MVCNKFLMSCFIIFTAFSLSAQSVSAKGVVNNNSENTKNKIAQVVEAYVQSSAFEGTILVAKSGQVIFEKAYGYANRSIKQKIKTSDSFQIASLSKPITATLVLMLVEQGKLKLESSLLEHFPEFDETIGSKITLHHLLSHTSGLPNHFVIDEWHSQEFHKKASESEFLALISKLRLEFEPGESYLYSNLGYYLIGKMIEKATGLSYSENLKRKIFAPLKMNNSYVELGMKLNEETVKGYRWKDGGGYREQGVKNMTLFGAGGAISTSVKDLYQLDLALYDNSLISNESKERLFNSKEGYSWRVGQLPLDSKEQVNFHSYNGQFEGNSSMMTRFIDDRHSIILLSNVGTNFYLKQQLSLDIADVLYDLEAPERKNDLTLSMINAMVSGEFDQIFEKLQSGNIQKTLDEQGLSSFAFQLLWSGLADKSLKLFSYISTRFSGSTNAKNNLMQACNHPLAQNAANKASICGS